jgi:shikimate kinase
MTPSPQGNAMPRAMMDDSKGRCQHEKIMEPCGPPRIAPGVASERRLDKGRARLAERKKDLKPEQLTAIREALGARSIVLIGLMGAGKTAVGRRLAAKLDLPFTDADTEIELAAGQTVSEIFADYGEPYFRKGEARVIARLLEGGPQVLATGGGAYMDEATRANIKGRGISIWLRAELPVLLHRVRRRDNRPLLASGDPDKVMRELMEKRYPIYAEADITVESRDVPHELIVADTVEALVRWLDREAKAAGGKARGKGE